jgi:hypothetical protein
VKPQLELEVIYEPHPDAERAIAEVLEIVAEEFVKQLVAQARAEVASELGVSEESIDREHGGVADELRTLRALPAAFDSTCEDHVTHAGNKDNDVVPCRRPRRKAGRKG